MSVNHEPTAAERYDGNKECQYGDCLRTADWLVEINHSALMYCCHDCGRKNRVHPYDVEDKEVTAK